MNNYQSNYDTEIKNVEQKDFKKSKSKLTVANKVNFGVTTTCS